MSQWVLIIRIRDASASKNIQEGLRNLFYCDLRAPSKTLKFIKQHSSKMRFLVFVKKKCAGDFTKFFLKLKIILHYEIPNNRYQRMKEKKTPKTNKHAKWSSAKHFLSDLVFKQLQLLVLTSVMWFICTNSDINYFLVLNWLLGGLIHRDISS